MADTGASAIDILLGSDTESDISDGDDLDTVSDISDGDDLGVADKPTPSKKPKVARQISPANTSKLRF
tara:strand:+ start:77 stop:280 length:204 start_codon:yes stop_codon:yes gene_type:complete